MTEPTRSGHAAVQKEGELSKFIALLREQKITSYLEIGSARGDTFFRVMEALPLASKGVAVDMPEQLWGLDGSRKQLEAVVDELSQLYKTYAVFGSSRALETVTEVAALGPYEAVFIDGDHSFEGVLTDFVMYGMEDSVRIVGFHDIADRGIPNLKGEVIEVRKFWQVVKHVVRTKFYKQWAIMEFIDEGSGMGIGVLVRKA